MSTNDEIVRGNRKIILEAIDEGLSIMGEKLKGTVYYFVEKRYGLRKEDVPTDLKKFQDALYSIFGLGANVIGKHIISCLERKLELELPIEPEGDFVTTLNDLMR